MAAMDTTHGVEHSPGDDLALLLRQLGECDPSDAPELADRLAAVLASRLGDETPTAGES